MTEERDAAEMRELELQRNAILLINKIEALRQQLAAMTAERDEAVSIATGLIAWAPITDADVKWAQDMLAAQKHQAGATMTPARALKFIERLLDAKSLLVIHGIISDSENARVNARLDRWAKKHGLKRKGTP